LVDSFLDMFNQFRRILCMCPHCNNLSRLSDLRLKSKEKIVKTWLDDFESNIQQLQRQEEKFQGEEKEIREKAAERGRAQVPKIVRKSMIKEFAKLKYDPYDIKAILHPIEFIVFDGMNKGEMNNVVLLAKQSSNPHLQAIQRKISSTIDEKKYDWKVLRAGVNGEIEIK
jgi:predicted Holliday junction resolvase-like endonuclease